MNLFSQCNGKELPKQMCWINEPAEWGFNGNNLAIDTSPITDFFRDPAGQNIKNSAPFLFTSVEGDFILTTKINVEMKEEYDSGCLMVMVDEKHWAKLCYECIKSVPTIVSVVTKDVSDDCISEKIGKASPYLRVQRSGNCIGFHFSLDAENWTMVRYFRMDAADALKIGVVAQSPVGKGNHVECEFLELICREVKDARVIDKIETK